MIMTARDSEDGSRREREGRSGAVQHTATVGQAADAAREGTRCGDLGSVSAGATRGDTGAGEGDVQADAGPVEEGETTE